MRTLTFKTRRGLTGDISLPTDLRAFDVAEIGYVEEEWFASGTATAFELVGALGADGRWDTAPADDTAPDDVARAVLFCASDLSIYMTGSTLLVDAGETL